MLSVEFINLMDFNLKGNYKMLELVENHLFNFPLEHGLKVEIGRS